MATTSLARSLFVEEADVGCEKDEDVTEEEEENGFSTDEEEKEPKEETTAGLIDAAQAGFADYEQFLRYFEEYHALEDKSQLLQAVRKISQSKNLKAIIDYVNKTLNSFSRDQKEQINNLTFDVLADMDPLVFKNRFPPSIISTSPRLTSAFTTPQTKAASSVAPSRISFAQGSPETFYDPDVDDPDASFIITNSKLTYDELKSRAKKWLDYIKTTFPIIEKKDLLFKYSELVAEFNQLIDKPGTRLNTSSLTKLIEDFKLLADNLRVNLQLQIDKNVSKDLNIAKLKFTTDANKTKLSLVVDKCFEQKEIDSLNSLLAGLDQIINNVNSLDVNLYISLEDYKNQLDTYQDDVNDYVIKYKHLVYLCNSKKTIERYLNNLRVIMIEINPIKEYILDRNLGNRLYITMDIFNTFLPQFETYFVALLLRINHRIENILLVNDTPDLKVDIDGAIDSNNTVLEYKNSIYTTIENETRYLFELLNEENVIGDNKCKLLAMLDDLDALILYLGLHLNQIDAEFHPDLNIIINMLQTNKTEIQTILQQLERVKIQTDDIYLQIDSFMYLTQIEINIVTKIQQFDEFLLNINNKRNAIIDKMRDTDQNKNNIIDVINDLIAKIQRDFTGEFQFNRYTFIKININDLLTEANDLLADTSVVSLKQLDDIFDKLQDAFRILSSLKMLEKSLDDVKYKINMIKVDAIKFKNKFETEQELDTILTFIELVFTELKFENFDEKEEQLAKYKQKIDKYFEVFQILEQHAVQINKITEMIKTLEKTDNVLQTYLSAVRYVYSNFITKLSTVNETNHAINILKVILLDTFGYTSLWNNLTLFLTNLEKTKTQLPQYLSKLDEQKAVIDKLLQLEIDVNDIDKIPTNVSNAINKIKTFVQDYRVTNSKLQEFVDLLKEKDNLVNELNQFKYFTEARDKIVSKLNKAFEDDLDMSLSKYKDVINYAKRFKMFYTYASRVYIKFVEYQAKIKAIQADTQLPEQFRKTGDEFTSKFKFPTAAEIISQPYFTGLTYKIEQLGSEISTYFFWFNSTARTLREVRRITDAAEAAINNFKPLTQEYTDLKRDRLATLENVHKGYLRDAKTAKEAEKQLENIRSFLYICQRLDEDQKNIIEFRANLVSKFNLNREFYSYYTAGEGNCMYYALIDMLNITAQLDQSNEHMNLRLQICAFVSEHLNELDIESLIKPFNPENVFDRDSVLLRQAENGAFGNNLYLEFAAYYFKVNIVLFYYSLETNQIAITVINTNSSNTCYIRQTEERGHFEFVSPNPPQQHPEKKLIMILHMNENTNIGSMIELDAIGQRSNPLIPLSTYLSKQNGNGYNNRTDRELLNIIQKNVAAFTSKPVTPAVIPPPPETKQQNSKSAPPSKTKQQNSQSAPPPKIEEQNLEQLMQTTEKLLRNNDSNQQPPPQSARPKPKPQLKPIQQSTNEQQQQPQQTQDVVPQPNIFLPPQSNGLFTASFKPILPISTPNVVVTPPNNNFLPPTSSGLFRMPNSSNFVPKVTENITLSTIKPFQPNWFPVNIMKEIPKKLPESNQNGLEEVQEANTAGSDDLNELLTKLYMLLVVYSYYYTRQEYKELIDLCYG